jgi:hypothetical protein
MSNKVFVSPGVYTSEKDLSFVTKSIGVTTLGLVGETVKGPAFQPIFVQDWGEFVNFFGERNSSKNKVTGYANYELPYVAKEYLSESNQLFVTRVLGLSGYDAGKAWAIKLKSKLDNNTLYTKPTRTYNPLFSFSATTSGKILNLVSSDSLFQYYYDLGLLNDKFTDIEDEIALGSAPITFNFNGTVYKQVDESFTGLTVSNWTLTNKGTYSSGQTLSASTFNSDKTNVIMNWNTNVITFAVNGLTSNISSIQLTLDTVNSTFDAYTTFVLESPTGEYYSLIKGATYGAPVYPYTVTFDSEATNVWGGGNSTSSLNKPTTWYTFTTPTPSSKTFSANTQTYPNIKEAFVGLPPSKTNGNWKLYIQELGGQAGSLKNASLTITSLTPPTQTIITGRTSGDVIENTGSYFSDVEDKVVALIRSRGYYDGDENLIYEVDGSTYSLNFDNYVTDALSNPKNNFALVGSSLVSGYFKYDLSFNKAKPNYITKVLGRTNNDGKTALFVEEVYQEMLDKFIDENKVAGLKYELVRYDNQFSKYKQIYKPAVTPWVVSELRGSNLLRLFRIWTISDGNAANKQFKISFTNIKLDDKEFDITVRNYYDTDANPQVFEKFSNLSMNPTSNNYIAKRIGTLNGDFPSKSNYILIEMDDTSDTSSAIPAGFTGYPIRKYEDTTFGTAKSPKINYKLNYGAAAGNAMKKVYLGISNTTSASNLLEDDLFTYKGVPYTYSADQWTGMTNGFHMDKDAYSATIDNVKIPIGGGNYFTPNYKFEVGADEFKSETGVIGTVYEKIYTRKFTLVPFGGYDGWDIYRQERTNSDNYTATGTRGVKGKNNGVFNTIALSNGDNGINSDYYAYLEAIWSFRNPEAVNINVFATPGINMFDHNNLHEETIEMIETERADSLYVAAIPDVDASNDVLMPEDVIDTLDGLGFDSNYTATYWPWIQVNDTYNNVYMWLPPTRDVVRNIAFTDKIKFPWFAVAGIERGNVDCIKARVKLTQDDRDVLYEGRVNPITTFATDGVKIWGNKTLQVSDTALNRINVRRLLLQARKLISAVSIRLLFEQNDAAVRSQFLSLVNPILDNIRADRGLTDFRVVLEDTPESIDRGELIGKIFLKPTRALEFIILEFNVMNTGASFDNV